MTDLDMLSAPISITLHLEPREDGGLRVSSPNVPGLILSSTDIEGLMHDLGPALQALLEHNGIVAVEAPDLDKLEALANAATAGPWRAVPAGGTQTRTVIVGAGLNAKHLATTDNSLINREEHEANAAFIAAARSAVPDMIAELRERRERQKEDDEIDALMAQSEEEQTAALLAQGLDPEEERRKASASIDKAMERFNAGLLQRDLDAASARITELEARPVPTDEALREVLVEHTMPDFKSDVLNRRTVYHSTQTGLAAMREAVARFSAPPVVTEEMVERACGAFNKALGSENEPHLSPAQGCIQREQMRKALEAVHVP